VFNMVPVPPLDGGNVLAGLLPRDAAAMFDRLRPFGIIILYALLLTGVLSALIVPPADFLMEILGL
jgi:Zn-dependent protease